VCCARWDRVGNQARDSCPAPASEVGWLVIQALVPLIWQNKRVLFTLLFEASASTTRNCRRQKHLGAKIGFLSILHYLEPDSTKAFPYSLRRTRGRVVARWYALDLFTLPFLSAGESTEPGVSRQVHRGIKTILPTKQARVSWRLPPVGTGAGPSRPTAHFVPAGVIVYPSRPLTIYQPKVCSVRPTICEKF